MPLAEIERTYLALAEVLRGRGRGAPGFYPRGVGSGPDAESPGEAFIRSDAYERWLADFPNGGPSQAQAGSFRSPPVEAKYSLANGSPGARALVTAADTSAGTLVPPDYRGLMEPGLVRPLIVRNLLTVLPTSSDTVEWVREASRVSAAAPVAEATALTGTSGTKPEGGLTFQAIQGVVRTFAVWIPATKRIIQDAPG